MWSGVPEFAAYFHFEILEVRGNTEICRTDPGIALPRPAILLSKFGSCSAGSDFPLTSENRVIQQRYAHQEAGLKKVLVLRWFAVYQRVRELFTRALRIKTILKRYANTANVFDEKIVKYYSVSNYLISER